MCLRWNAVALCTVNRKDFASHRLEIVHMNSMRSYHNGERTDLLIELDLKKKIEETADGYTDEIEKLKNMLEEVCLT